MMSPLGKRGTRGGERERETPIRLKRRGDERGAKSGRGGEQEEKSECIVILCHRLKEGRRKRRRRCSDKEERT